MIQVDCTELRVQKIDNDINGNGIIVFARTYLHKGAVIHDTVTLSFDEAEKVVFKFAG